MEPSVPLLSSTVEPLIRPLFRPPDPRPPTTSDSGSGSSSDSGEADAPLLPSLVTFRGDHPALGYEALYDAARELTGLGRRAADGGAGVAGFEEEGVATVLFHTLWVLGDLDITDAQA